MAVTGEDLALNLDNEVGDSSVKRSLTKRFRKVSKKYRASNSEKHRKLDEFTVNLCAILA